MIWARDAKGNSFPVPPDKNPTPQQLTESHMKMVDWWWALGFVIETQPKDGTKDLYEVEFDKHNDGVPPPSAPPASAVVAATTAPAPDAV